MELNITPMREWLPDVKKPLIIAGPCSAEHEDQVVNTAKEIHALGYERAQRKALGLRR